MLFWLAAAALTLIASLAVLWPWVRPLAPADDLSAGDMAVYRDQLVEIDRDVARGAMPAESAAEARNEIARRALKAAAQPAGTLRGAAPKALAVLAVLAVPVLGWGVYASMGAPGLPSQPLAERMARNPSQNSVDELVARAEMHLRENPDDASGWEVIAPIYVRMGRGAEAVAAFANVIRLSGATAEREANLGEALLSRDNGIAGAEARAAFERALKLDAKSAKARFFVALCDAQAGRLESARTQWTALIAETPPESPWDGAGREALAQLDQIAAAPADKGPNADDVAAASEMSAGDRAAMIETMVERLDADLRDNPGNLEGWKKLVRSYLVMGKADAARDALKRAETGLDAEKMAELKSFARDAGMTGLD